MSYCPSRRLRPVVYFGLLIGALVLPCGAQAQDAAMQFIDLPDLEISDVLKMISDTSGWTIVPSQDVKGRVTAYIKDTDVETALEVLLEMNDYRFIREGDIIKVMSIEDYALRMGPEVKMAVLDLEYARPQDVVSVVQGALSSQGKIFPDQANNQVVVFDLPVYHDAIAALIGELDQKLETRVIPLEHAQAAAMLQSLQSLMGNRDAFDIDERTNQLIITDTPSRLDRIEETVNRLDLEDMTETRVYPLKYAEAQEVADLLTEMITGRRAGAGAGYGRGSRFGGSQGQQAAVVRPAETASQQQQEGFRSPIASDIPRTTTDRRGIFSPGSEGGQTGLPSPPAGQTESAPSQPAGGESVTGTAMFEEARALGVQGTIVADPRTNTIVVTHTPSVLERVERVLETLDVETELHIYQIGYADPEALGLEDRLAQLLPGPADDYQIDVGTRKVTFRASPERSRYILALLKEWDQPTPQVFIEARIMRVALDAMRDIGITFQAEDLRDDGALKSSVGILFPPNIPEVPQGIVQAADLERDEYTVILQALESDTRSKLVSNPKVAVMDREQAVFQVATDEPYTEIVTDAQADITLQNTRFIPVGVILMVQPSIGNEGQIRIDVNVQISSLVGFSSSDVPIVDKAEAESSVTVTDGHTFAMGGLIVDEKIKTVNKVPILGDIPLLKYLFRNTSEDTQQTELLVFVTPRIADTGVLEPPPDQLHLPPSKIDLDD